MGVPQALKCFRLEGCMWVPSATKTNRFAPRIGDGNSGDRVHNCADYLGRIDPGKRIENIADSLCDGMQSRRESYGGDGDGDKDGDNHKSQPGGMDGKIRGGGVAFWEEVGVFL